MSFPSTLIILLKEVGKWLTTDRFLGVAVLEVLVGGGGLFDEEVRF